MILKIFLIFGNLSLDDSYKLDSYKKSVYYVWYTINKESHLSLCMLVLIGPQADSTVIPLYSRHLRDQTKMSAIASCPLHRGFFQSNTCFYDLEKSPISNFY